MPTSHRHHRRHRHTRVRNRRQSLLIWAALGAMALVTFVVVHFLVGASQAPPSG